MINITHSLWWINLILILISLWIINDASIWIIVFSIFLWQIMDLDHAWAWISKKVGLRSLSKTVISFTSWHRKETHSIFFALIVTIILLPISMYFSINDWSNLLGNSLVIFFSILSHALLDMFNKQEIPLFYVPIINPIWKAKWYTYYNFLSNIAENFWLWNLKDKLRIKSFNGWLEVSSEKEFWIFTMPLMIIFFILIFFKWDYITLKIYEWSQFIINHVYFSLIMLILSVKNNYLFKEKGWLKDFVSGLIRFSDKPEYWKWSDFSKIFWETNFTKIIIFLLIILSIINYPDQYVNNWIDSIYSTIEFFKINTLNLESIKMIIMKINNYIF